MPMKKLKTSYGLWRVIADAGRNVKVVCKCGRKAEVFRYNLTRGLSTGCAACANRRTKTGRLAARYGRWKVMGPVPGPGDGNGAMVKVRCNCGAESTLRATDLRVEHSTGCKRCGAAARERRRKKN